MSLTHNGLRLPPHLVQELPSHPEARAIGRNPKSGDIGEVRGTEVPAIPVEREALQLDLHQAAEEGGAVEPHRRTPGVPSDHPIAPRLHAQTQLQVEDAAGKLAQEFRPQGDGGLGVRGWEAFGYAVTRVAVPPLESDPPNRGDPRTDRPPLRLGHRSDRRNPKELGIAEWTERRGPAPSGLEPEA